MSDNEQTLAQASRSIVIGKSDIVILPNVGRIPRKAIRNAYVATRYADAPRVILERSWLRRAIWIRVDTLEQGEELVASLGFAERQHRIQFFGAPSGGRLVALLVFLGLGVVGSALGLLRLETALLGTLYLYALVSLVLYATRPWITVGPEGLTFHRLLVRERLSFADVDAIEGKFSGLRNQIVFVRRNATTPRVFVVDDDSYFAVIDHARRAFTAYRAKHPPNALDVLLERSGRTNEEWLRGLRALRSANRYRIAAIDPSELEKIMHDGAKPEHLRVAAEIALSADDDDEKRIAELAALDRGDS